MKTLFFITAMALISGINMETCPSEEDIYPCDCDTSDSGDVSVMCSGNSESDQSELRKLLKGLSGKENVTLSLRDFALGRVPSDIFSGIGIKELYISECDVETLADGGPPFQGLEDTLEGIMIDKTLKGDPVEAKLQFGHLNRLKRLFLHENTIEELGDDWFQDGPVSLDFVMITNNQIGKIGSNAFASLVNLEWLFVGGNRFGQFQRSMFPNPANKLELLNLQDNGLTELPEDIFTNMPKLVEVQINGNGIDAIDEGVWSGVWQQLKWIMIEGNPIRCDDSMSWLFNLDCPRFYFAECDSPEEVRGQLIEDFINSSRSQ